MNVWRDNYIELNSPQLEDNNHAKYAVHLTGYTKLFLGKEGMNTDTAIQCISMWLKEFKRITFKDILL